jgi:ABC-type Fe3+ transport system permease subunit
MISVVISLLAAIVFFRSARAARRRRAWLWALIGMACVLCPGLLLGMGWKLLILPALPEGGLLIEHFALTNLVYSSLTLVVELVIVFRVHDRYLRVVPDGGTVSARPRPASDKGMVP